MENIDQRMARLEKLERDWKKMRHLLALIYLKADNTDVDEEVFNVIKSLELTPETYKGYVVQTTNQGEMK